jgi:hypothetical protein
MILYRGLSFPSSTVGEHVDHIQRHGLLAGAGKWRMLFPDLKPRLDELWRRSNLERSDVHTENQTPDWVCACAQRRDALYYACQHNPSAEHDASVLVTCEAEIRDMIVNGRDFLYTAPGPCLGDNAYHLR